VLVNSSVSEGMSNAVLEALALGACVAVVRDNPGNRALVRHRVDGLVFRTPTEFVDLVRELLGDAALAERLRTAARERAAKHHAREDEAREYDRILSGVVGDGR